MVCNCYTKAQAEKDILSGLQYGMHMQYKEL